MPARDPAPAALFWASPIQARLRALARSLGAADPAM
jgi:hypothetical protein